MTHPIPTARHTASAYTNISTTSKTGHMCNLLAKSSFYFSVLFLCTSCRVSLLFDDTHAPLLAVSPGAYDVIQTGRSAGSSCMQSCHTLQHCSLARPLCMHHSLRIAYLTLLLQVRGKYHTNICVSVLSSGQ